MGADNQLQTHGLRSGVGRMMPPASAFLSLTRLGRASYRVLQLIRISLRAYSELTVGGPLCGTFVAHSDTNGSNGVLGSPVAGCSPT